MLEIVGYLSAVLIGISLGLIGSGGSILTVPILVYLFGIVPVVATGYSLFVVGLTSLVGFTRYFKQDLVSLKTAVVFGVPSLISVFFTRKVLLPAIPETLFSIDNFYLGKNVAIMILFALLMISASISMIKKDKKKDCPETEKPQKFNYFIILIEGAVVGVLTGLVGAGGGFLIIPALVLLSGLSMKLAVGTSLLIIAVKSLSGFIGDMMQPHYIDWPFLLIFSLLSIIGIVIGNYLAKYIPGSKLKPAFGWFVLVMGCYIIVKELFSHIL